MSGFWLAGLGAVWVVLFVLKQRSLISPAAAREYLRQGALIVDVRSAGEYQQEHLSNAVNIPPGELPERLPRLVQDQQQVILLHCLSGTRSGSAQGQLQRLGYARVFNLGSYGRAAKILSGK